MGRGIEFKNAWERDHDKYGMLKPRMVRAKLQLAEALNEAGEGSQVVEAFEDFGKQRAAQEKTKLTVIGRVLLRTTRTRNEKDLAEANERVETRSLGDNAQEYLAARNSAKEVFNYYFGYYLGDLYEKRKTPIVRPHYHEAKAADKFLADIHEITANEQRK